MCSIFLGLVRFIWKIVIDIYTKIYMFYENISKMYRLTSDEKQPGQCHETICLPVMAARRCNIFFLFLFIDLANCMCILK